MIIFPDVFDIFSLPEDLKLLRDGTRKLVNEEFIPREKEIDEKEIMPEDLFKKLRELGYFGITIPEKYGGIGAGQLGYMLVQEELGRTHECFNAVLSANNGIGSLGILFSGTEEQKQKYLPKLAAGEWISAFALTEPGAGSDAASIKTKAEKKGDRYLINGTKHFITRGDIADLLFVIAVTDASKGAKGISAFIVEKSFPGVRVARRHNTMGSDVIGQAEIVFEDAEVPEENLVGKEGEGFKVALKALSYGRLNIASRALGVSKRLFEMALSYSRERNQFGQPIGNFQGIQWMLSEMATLIYHMQCAIYASGIYNEKVKRAYKEVSMVKLFSSENAWKVADMALQIFGGMGYMKDLPVERFLRDLRAYRIVEGTSEIQRVIIARELMRYI